VKFRIVIGNFMLSNCDGSGLLFRLQEHRSRGRKNTASGSDKALGGSSQGRWVQWDQVFPSRKNHRVGC
jgi:hypothetical protein